MCHGFVIVAHLLAYLLTVATVLGRGPIVVPVFGGKRRADDVAVDGRDAVVGRHGVTRVAAEQSAERRPVICRFAADRERVFGIVPLAGRARLHLLKSNMVTY